MGKLKGVEDAVDQKVRFVEWFADACNGQFVGLKPHHMNEIRAYFIYLGIPDPATPLDYDTGMEKFGFKKKLLKGEK